MFSRFLVAMARATVMVLGMAGAMMVTPGVSGGWFVAQTTARSLDCITTRRTTAAMCLTLCRQPRSQTHLASAVFLWNQNQVNKEKK